MSPILISLVVFACVFGGALSGMGLRTVLPEHHRNTESRDVVKLGMGLPPHPVVPHRLGRRYFMHLRTSVRTWSAAPMRINPTRGYSRSRIM